MEIVVSYSISKETSYLKKKWCVLKVRVGSVKYWDLSVRCWVLSWSATTSISLLLNWISMGHVKMTEVSDSWPQGCRPVTHQIHKELHGVPQPGVIGAELPAPWHNLQKHPELLSKCSFSLPSGKIHVHSPPSAISCSKPSLLLLAFFFLMSMLMNSWQISDSYFHSFTFTRGNIPLYFKKRKWRWTIFENLAPKCYAFHLTFPELFAGGRLESSLKPGPQLGSTKTFRIYSFYIIHLFRALLHFAITWSSQFSSQIGFGDKMLEQVREYYFKLNIFSIEWLWLL